jgi:O-antigen/teichoic acid export membrane protein
MLRDLALPSLRDRGRLVAGLFDSGLSSLATFSIGICAIRLLDPAALGSYALCYRAVFLVAFIPGELIFAPAEVRIVGLDPNQRLGMLTRSILLGLPAALGAGLMVMGWMFFAPPEVLDSVLWPLTTTAMASAFLSPIQDHIRRMLHIGGRSEVAAIVSGVQLVTAVAAIASLIVLNVPPAWIPFAALGSANLVSSVVGVFLGRRGSAAPNDKVLSYPDLVKTGRWLVVTGMAGPAAAFGVASIVGFLAGAVALGYAEAARVVASPLLVFGNGLWFVLNPHAVRAARERNRENAAGLYRQYAAGAVAALVGAMVFLGADWPWNPVAGLMSKAYVVPGLVALYLLADVAFMSSWLFRSEILGGGREAAMTRIEIPVSVASLAVAATAGVLHAYAIPLATLSGSILRWLAYRGVLKGIYEPRS